MDQIHDEWEQRREAERVQFENMTCEPPDYCPDARCWQYAPCTMHSCAAKQSVWRTEEMEQAAHSIPSRPRRPSCFLHNPPSCCCYTKPLLEEEDATMMSQSTTTPSQPSTGEQRTTPAKPSADVQKLIAILRNREIWVSTVNYTEEASPRMNDLRRGHLTICSTQTGTFHNCVSSNMLCDVQWEHVVKDLHSVTLWRFNLDDMDKRWFENANIAVYNKCW